MCDTYKPPSPKDAGHDIKLEALPTNTRQACAAAMEKAKDQKPWFGIEQVRPLLPCPGLIKRSRWRMQDVED